MTFIISERTESVLYQDYAAALHAKMKAREKVKRVSSHDRRHFTAQHDYICATTAVMLIECEETWKDVPGYGEHYQASTLGRVRSKDRIVTKRHSSGAIMNQSYKGKVLSPNKTDKYGHLAVHIGHDGQKHTVFVHKLVLLAFVGPCPSGCECCHNNGDAGDNRPENLRWDTHHNNNQDRKKHGTYADGEDHHMTKLTDKEVVEIFKSNDSGVAIAKRFGVGCSQVSRIRRGLSRLTATGGLL